MTEASCRSASAHQTMGFVCAKKAFRGARQAFLMLLAALRFRRGRLTGRAAPGTPEVDGSAPPVETYGSARRGVLICTAAPPLGRVAPVQNPPCGEAFEPAEEAGAALFGSAVPTGGRLWPTCKHGC